MLPGVNISMPRKIPLPKEKGFSLLLIVLIFAGLAVVAISAVTFTAKIKNISLEADTVKRLAVITDAVKRYYRAREALPPSPAGTEVPVGAQDLNLDQKFRHDAWGQLVEYYVDPNVPGAGLTAVNVEGRNVAGYVLSYGANQTKETDTAVSPIVRGGDDILRPINLQTEARDIALDELTLICKKACAYWLATGTPAPDVDPTLINHFSLSDKYKLDPWGNAYQPNPDLADNNFYSYGPSGVDGPDNIYGPPVLAAQCQGTTPPPTPPVSHFNFEEAPVAEQVWIPFFGWITLGYTVPAEGGPDGYYATSGNTGISQVAEGVPGGDGYSYQFVPTANWWQRRGITVNENIGPDVMPDLTITAWVRPSSVSNIAAVVSTNDIVAPGNDRAMGLADPDGDTVYGWAVTGGPTYGLLGQEPIDCNVGQWYHVAAVYQQDSAAPYTGTVTLYVDGELAWSAPAARDADPNPGEPFYVIGAMAILPGGGVWYPFYGLIDDVAVYDYALTQSNIQYLYNNP